MVPAPRELESSDSEEREVNPYRFVRAVKAFRVE
jgi:hypothetical protein